MIVNSHIPKILGADCELANFVLGLDFEVSTGTGSVASRALLREISGLPVREEPGVHDRNGQSVRGFERMDWGRRFLRNGGCAYIDSDHLEICIPEVRSAADFVAAWHGMLQIAAGARMRANRKLTEGRTIEVIANTSDGRGNSFGSHLNVALSRPAWSNLFHRKMHHLLWLASYQVTSIIFTGAGKVGSENKAPYAGYQLSQRADFFEQLTSQHTTFNRGIVNSRDEGLAGNKPDSARLHCIFYDTNLCHVSNYLKAGVLQIIAAMLEAGHIDPELILDDSLSALATVSRDLSFTALIETSAGKRLSAVDLQTEFHRQASLFVATGQCEGIVPGAAEILRVWGETLDLLRNQDMDRLSARLDWALKLSILGRMMERDPALDYASSQIRYLDHLYANLNPEQGLYWAYERAGAVDRIASAEDIGRLRLDPPEDTRAWTRAHLLRRADPEVVADVDWDMVRFHVRDTNGRHFRAYTRRFAMDDPAGFTRAECETAFADGAPLEQILDALEGASPPAQKWAAAQIL
jgi:proteasome accessory factor A